MHNFLITFIVPVISEFFLLFGLGFFIFFIIALIDKCITDTKAWINKRKHKRKLDREGKVKELVTEIIIPLIRA